MVGFGQLKIITKKIIDTSGKFSAFKNAAEKGTAYAMKKKNCQSSLECYSGFHLLCILSLVLAGGQQYFK